MRERYEKGLATRLGNELCGGDGDIAREASAVVPRDARGEKKWNPLHCNEFRPRTTQTPGKKETLAPQRLTPISAQAGPSIAAQNPKRAQKRKPLSPKTLRSQFRLLSRPKHAWKKSPRPLPRGSQK